MQHGRSRSAWRVRGEEGRSRWGVRREEGWRREDSTRRSRTERRVQEKVESRSRTARNETFESVSKIVETMWQSLEEGQKEKYKKMNEVDKERFLREKEAGVCDCTRASL